MDCNIIVYILVVLIVAAVLNIFLNKFNKGKCGAHKNEENENIKPVVHYVNLVSPEQRRQHYEKDIDGRYTIEINKNTNNDNNKDDSTTFSLSGQSSDNSSLSSGTNKSFDECFGKTPVDVGAFIVGDDKYADDFFKEYVFNGRNKLPVVKLNVEQEKEFKENYFTFRDRVWDSSHGEDAVDKLNDIYLEENEEGIRVESDMKIKDIFDSLTANNTARIRLPKIDEITNTGYYTKNGFGGKYTTDEMVVYENERIMNGGVYYNNIYGDDQSKESPMFLGQ